MMREHTDQKFMAATDAVLSLIERSRRGDQDVIKLVAQVSERVAAVASNPLATTSAKLSPRSPDTTASQRFAPFVMAMLVLANVA